MKSSQKSRHPYYNPTTLLIIICAFFVAGLFFYIWQLKSVVETSRNEVKKIPSDVKREVIKQKQTTIAASLRVPILLYHYVEYVQDKKDTIRQSLDIIPSIFEEQIQTLQNAGYTFITAKELGYILDGSMPLPPHPIMLTFDDGHWDFDTVVLPILKKYHVKATAYIVSGFLGGSDFMTTDQLKDVVQSGLVDVGAHTVHHIALKDKLSPIVTYEVVQSKKALEDMYHISVVSFAYPDGSFDVQAAKAVKDAGYTTAVSTIPGIQQDQLNRYFLYRIRPGGRTGKDLLEYLQQNSFKPY